MDFDIKELIVLSAMLFLPVLVLLAGICIALKRRKQNKSIWTTILITTLFVLFTIFPFVYSIVKKDGLSFFMAIIMEYYAVSVAIPWFILLAFSSLIIKKIKYMSSRQKILSVILLLLLLAVCIGITITAIK